jgi:hypothetical protein
VERRKLSRRGRIPLSRRVPSFTDERALEGLLLSSVLAASTREAFRDRTSQLHARLAFAIPPLPCAREHGAFLSCPNPSKSATGFG